MSESATTPDFETCVAQSPALDRACHALLALQKPDGHWVAELQGDTILETEWILLLAFLGRERDPRVGKAAQYVLNQQLPGGGWAIYPGGPLEISASVKAYFVLKLAGHDPEADYMRRARAAIRAHGGADACNSFSKFYLALLGQFPYDSCPAVPPEMMFLPTWSYFNIYAMSSWSRTIFIPLTIFYAYQPVRRLPADKGIAELFLEDPWQPRWPQPPSPRWFSWHNFFLLTDWLIKRCDRGSAVRCSAWEGEGQVASARRLFTAPFRMVRDAVRRRAVKRAERWMLEHFEESDGVGAIFPPMIYTVIALRCLGYADDSPEMKYALKQLDDLIIEENGTIRLQPCVSPVWDTGIALNAVADALPEAASPAAREALRIGLERGIAWVLTKEVRRRGDWAKTAPHLQAGGWFFEYHNAFYPDTDDTAMVLMALAKCRMPHAECRITADLAAPIDRGLQWLIGMQNNDGGWAAFDRNINRQVLEKVPFADHNAMLDPSCPDITARVFESLGYHGYKAGQKIVDRGIDFVRREQDPCGAWWGRWGVNYLYGTWQVLQGLQAVGFDMQDPMVRRAVAWLKEVQQPDGGWGETCASYDDPALKGKGEPTASQTAWAVLGLIAAGEAGSPAVQHGIEYLRRTQLLDGTWQEQLFTGTGFPKVFYLKYHLYALYFPLMALARYERAANISRNHNGPGG